MKQSLLDIVRSVAIFLETKELRTSSAGALQASTSHFLPASRPTATTMDGRRINMEELMLIQNRNWLIEKIETEEEEETGSETNSDDSSLKTTRSFCPICDLQVGDHETAKHHLRFHSYVDLFYPQLTPLPCDHCKTFFLSPIDLTKHHCDRIDRRFTDAHLVCGLCYCQYSTVADLKAHLLLHMERNGASLPCPIPACGAIYAKYIRLAAHLESKHFPTKLSCSHCDQRFPTESHLHLHLRSGCSARHFQCFHCDRAFFDRKNLDLHLKHTLEGKQFTCAVCGKSFATKGNLDLHQRSHSDTRNYACGVCNAAFKTASLRASHLEYHLKDKNFPCTVCEKRFQSRATLRMHMKRHTGERRHPCHCGKKFFYAYELKKHQTAVHDTLGLKA